MASWPCSNPSCSSEGRPHPNCRCPQPHADGGEVKPYCSENRAHLETCEYYAKGGDVAPKFEDTVPVESAPKFEDTEAVEEAPKFEDTVPVDQKEMSVGDHVKAGIEGFGRGVTFGLTDALAKPLRSLGEKIGVDPDIMAPKPEELAERKESVTGQIAKSAGNVASVLGGEALISATGLISPAASTLGKIGSGAIKGFIESGIMQGGDEVSTYLLGQGDPEASVASSIGHMGAAGLFGLGSGAVFGTTSAGLKALGDSKAGNKIASFLAGVGFNNSSKDEVLKKIVSKSDSINEKFFGLGEKFGGDIPKLASDLVTRRLTEGVGLKFGGVPGYFLAEKLIGPKIQQLIGEPIGAVAKKYSVPVALKLLSSGEAAIPGVGHGLFELLDHAAKMGKGLQKINSGVDAIFKSGSQKAVDSYFDEKARDKTKKYVEDGDLNQEIQNDLAQSNAPAFAEGGEVTPGLNNNPMATHYPTHNMMMQTAKARVNGYLNTIRPQKDVMKLPFDKTPKDKQKLRQYDKAIDLANQPLRILNHVKDGSLTPDQMKHFTQMYPELYGFLSKKLTAKIADHQMKEETPSYKVRQALSLFLGAPLDSTMTPQSIQAAQSVFANKRAQQQQAPDPAKNKKGTSTLSKVDQAYQTGDQARLERQQKS